jgi:glycosyltransferase involved in cell wall biosynthesis
LFNPAVRKGKNRSDGRFRVFSGGKSEYRKGQDLVLEAFSIFAKKHPDAELVAAWSSPWPHLSRTFDGVTRIGGPPTATDGSPDYRTWALRYGISPQQFTLIPQIPNYLFPKVLSEIDVAVFPNRIEGGTNLVAMECLACGVPTILAAGYGHDDLIDGSDAISFVPAESNPFWRGSEVEPIVAALQDVYDGKAAVISPLDATWAWPTRIEQLIGILRDFT